MPLDYETIVLAEIGRALIFVQQFEGYLTKCLKLVGLASAKPTSLDRKTLGRLMAELRKKLDLPSDFEKAFSNLLGARNLFVHHLSSEEWFALTTREGGIAILSFVQRMLNLCQECNGVLVAYMLIEARERGALTPKVTSTIDKDFIRRLDQEIIPRIRRRR